jgi:gamma-glutamylcyclotransferase (GGCT)/AIG2-like uncharacterized protein YtfP
MLVSVYGTLRKGERANDMLEGSEFIGETTESIPFVMLNLGSFPALFESECNNDITLETYRVNDVNTLKRLDRYEGYPSLYNKRKITLKSGEKSVVYFMESEPYGKLIKSGNWKNK